MIFIQIEEDYTGRVGVLVMKKSSGGKQFTEDWIPIKQILNGVITTDNGEFVTGIKVMPRNIFMLERSQQNSIIYNLRNLYNSIDYEFWLIIADRPVDINVYLASLQLMYNNTNNSYTRKMIMQDINKANNFMSSEYNVVDTEYFILFKKKKMEILQKKLHSLISNFATCGLNTIQTSNDDLRMILDNFLNAGYTTKFGTVMS